MVFVRAHQIFGFLCFLFAGLAFPTGPTLSKEPDERPKYSEGVRTITIEMESYTFMPQTLTAEMGEPIEFLLKNESFLVPHNFLLDSPDGIRLVEANVGSGEQSLILFTPTQSGVYVFYCDKQLLFFPNHREEGMEGFLTVR